MFALVSYRKLRSKFSKEYYFEWFTICPYQGKNVMQTVLFFSNKNFTKKSKKSRSRNRKHHECHWEDRTVLTIRFVCKFLDLTFASHLRSMRFILSLEWKNFKTCSHPAMFFFWRWWFPHGNFIGSGKDHFSQVSTTGDWPMIGASNIFQHLQKLIGVDALLIQPADWFKK